MSRQCHRHPAFGDYFDFTWCAQCQRVYRTRQWMESDWHCPTEGCCGQPTDAWRWEEVQGTQPRFPARPQVGRRYRLYRLPEAEDAALAEVPAEVMD